MKYSVHIELKRAANNDYQVLNNALKAKNFQQYVNTGKFDYQGNQNRIEILETVKDAVAKTGREAQVQLIESTKKWFGFEHTNSIFASIRLN